MQDLTDSKADEGMNIESASSITARIRERGTSVKSLHEASPFWEINYCWSNSPNRELDLSEVLLKAEPTVEAHRKRLFNLLSMSVQDRVILH